MDFNTVVTHDTTFHADDVFAVAILQTVSNTLNGVVPRHYLKHWPVGDINVNGFKLVRTRDPEILAAAQADRYTVVLDVGGIYDPAMLNFDHHQDVSLVSAAGLVYERFKDFFCPGYAQPYLQEFITAIDLIDTNRDNIYGVWETLPVGFRNVSSIIGGFNRDVNNADEQMEQFQKAVDFAVAILANEIQAAIHKAEFEGIYAQRQILPNNVAVFDRLFRNWKEKKDHIFAVMPHANGWQIQSRDTTIDKIPESVAECPGFIFRHGSGFMAVVKEKEVAISFAKTLPQLL